MHKIVLAGSVTSSFATLQKLIEHGMNLVAVLGYEPKDIKKVSGYVNMKSFCDCHSIPYFSFTKISSLESIELLRKLKPDIFFVVGLSQLVPEEILSISRLGNIGFHPTFLPKGRGRAPIAWLILEETRGAASFFLMGKGADDGPIFIQQPFDVSINDEASDIEQKILVSINTALDKWLPALKKGIWNPIPQNEALASYYGKRTPEDGWLDWHLDAVKLNKLIKATAPPHPGAFTFLNLKKLYVLRSRIEMDINIKGVIGRILKVEEEEFLIQTGNGLIWISEIINEDGIKELLSVGQRLGYYVELELYNLKKEISHLKKELGL